MKKRLLLSTCVVHIFTLTTHLYAQECLTNNESERGECHQQSSCSLYLAPSTIPNAGLGVFTGVEMLEGDMFDITDLAIPLIDMQKHNNQKSVIVKEFGQDQDQHLDSLLDHYVWELYAMNMEREAAQGCSFSPGLYAATNCFPPLTNINGAQSTINDYGLHRSVDPGAGAMTLYNSAESTWATRQIPAGGELFLDYGDEWFTSREINHIPLRSDLEEAERLMVKFGTITGNSTNSDLQHDLWNLIISIPHSSLVTSVFPKSLDKVMSVIKQGDAGTLYQEKATRSIDYLDQHGTCLDIIRPGSSALPGAGLGAFVTRPFVKGEVIMTSPVIHIPDHSSMDMYRKQWSSKYWNKWRPSKEVESHQLLVNYCFGHRQSTVLLCPYASGVNYINHNQSLANVQIDWTTHGRLSHDATLLTRSLNDLPAHKSALAFDYIAIRDILPGDELFLDGGNAWEETWQSHVELLDAENEAERTYQPASVWNELLRSEPLRTNAEQHEDPYPPHLELRCHEFLQTDYHNWKRTILEKGDNLWGPLERGLPCNILRRYLDKEEGDTNHQLVYDVNFFDDEEDTEVQNKAVPRNAFFFVDGWYSTDMHLANAFRYPMQIPENMLPEQWKKDYDNQLD